MDCTFNPLIYHSGCKTRCIQRFEFPHQIPHEIFVLTTQFADDDTITNLAATCKGLMCCLPRTLDMTIKYLYKYNDLNSFISIKHTSPQYCAIKRITGIRGIKWVRGKLWCFNSFYTQYGRQYVFGRGFNYYGGKVHFRGIIRREVLSADVRHKRLHHAAAELRTKFPAELELNEAKFRARLYWNDLIIEYNGVCAPDCQHIIQYDTQILRCTGWNPKMAKLLDFLGVPYPTF